MNKLTKLGIVTFSAVTLSAAVPTLVRAEENVAPQPNVAAKPNVAQPTPAPKPNGSWVDFSMLDPIAKPKPGKEVSKPAEKPVEEPAPVEKPSTEGNILANGTDEAIAEDKKNAEIEKKYNVDPTNQLPEPGLPIITPEPEQPITDPEEMKRIVAEDLAYKNGAAKTQEERNKLIVEANEKLYAANGVDIDELIHRPIPGKPGAVQAVPDISARTYEIQADFLDADRVQKYGYTTESRIDSPKRAEVWSTWNAPDKDSADGILTAKKFSDYTFSHVVKSAADHPDIDPDPKVVRVSYDAAYALRGSGYKNGKGDNLFRYYFIYTKNKPVEEKPTPKDPQPAETEKPAEISKPVETVKPTEQPKPVENKPVENKLAETPISTPKPAENPQPEVKPAEQPQPAKPEKPAEKPSENPVNPVTPVAPITPTTPVTPTLNPAIPNNTRVLSSEAGSVQVYGSEATLKNVRYIRVEETKSNSLESKKYKAFDIHLYDARGKAIQPNGMVLVSLSADKPVENVYYVAPDGTLQALKFKQDTDKVTFETNHFSIYAMTFKVAASRDNGGTTIPVPVVNSNNTPTTTEQNGNDSSSTKTQAEPLATKTETISKQVAKTLPNTGENHSILATLFGMLTLTAGLFSFRKESE